MSEIGSIRDVQERISSLISGINQAYLASNGEAYYKLVRTLYREIIPKLDETETTKINDKLAELVKVRSDYIDNPRMNINQMIPGDLANALEKVELLLRKQVEKHYNFKQKNEVLR